jgi:N-acetyl-gamma-glutamylphosphate reductase
MTPVTAEDVAQAKQNVQDIADEMAYYRLNPEVKYISYYGREKKEKHADREHREAWIRDLVAARG